MARWIELTCPTCGHKWRVDLDKYQAEQVIYKGEKRVREESYRFRCPQDGTFVVADIEIEE